jgi:hypothetical protein
MENQRRFEQVVISHASRDRVKLPCLRLAKKREKAKKGTRILACRHLYPHSSCHPPSHDFFSLPSAVLSSRLLWLSILQTPLPPAVCWTK